MIGPVVHLVRDLIVTPQTADDVPADRRLYLDPDAVPIDVHAQTAEVVAGTTVPTGVEIGAGHAVPHVRHEVDVIVQIEHADPVEALRRRDAVVLDLYLRAVAADWHGTTLEGQQLDAPPLPTVRYAEGAADDPDTLGAYAVLTFPVDATVHG